MSVARVALPVAVAQLFDYWVPSGIDVTAGALVKVRLARKPRTGVVVDVVENADVPRDQLFPLEEVVALPPLAADVRELVSFVASYYQVPIGLAYGLAIPPLGSTRTLSRTLPESLALCENGRNELPSLLGRAPSARALFERLVAKEAVLTPEDVRALSRAERRTLARWREAGYVAPASRHDRSAAALRLNDDQRDAVERVLATRGRFAATLLQGVTGSGKTEVYLAAAAACIASGGQVLMLVPEINLTPQLVMRVSAALPAARTAILHSGLPETERRAHWVAAATGAADVVLGTRLAVFSTLPRLALIVVDEEHDGSYKQQEGVRYHARDAAVWRARHRCVPIVLGSATPSLETFAHAEAGRYARIVLDKRADPRASPPAVRLLPARGSHAPGGLSSELLEAIRQRLQRNEQSLVFVNRRGFAPSLRCTACSWEAGCPRCSARLTAHRVPSGLVCHHCGHREHIPRACPECGNVDLAPVGHGTQRLEQALADAFPSARIARVDRDTTRRSGSFAALRERVTANALDILIGTQMLAKGHDFPRLTLVGVLGADNALYSADFRATERLAALLVQVAGRAGRADLRGEVLVQTDFPAHPLFGALVRHDYDAFARDLLGEREAGGLPPFAHLALLSAEAHQRDDVDRFLADAHELAQSQRRALGVVVDVFSPVPSPLERRAGFERGQMLLRSHRRGELQQMLGALRGTLDASASRRVRWAIDVDPAGLA